MRPTFDNNDQLTVTIKNMVCPRCVEAVTRIAASIDLQRNHVSLGKVVLDEVPTLAQKERFANCLKENGFAIVENSQSRLMSQVKTLIINRIHYINDSSDLKLSVYLSQNLHYDYTRLSKLFSSTEGITIERFATLQRLERAKELLVYDQQNISEIAAQLDYSSAAHLSSQFKRETGMTPSEFKRPRHPPRRSLDAI